MEFPVKRREIPSSHIPDDIQQIAYQFTTLVHKELGDLVRAVVLFGSASREPAKKPHDIDILIIIDDVHVTFTAELQQAYRIIVENCVRHVDTRLHITTLRFSNFWEYVRTTDPIVATILRDGIAILDTGFFGPMQLLLRQGRLRPTHEAMWSYWARAPQLTLASKWKLMLGIIDLYWAVINSAHAALMAAGVTPQTPEHVPQLLKEHFVDKGLLDEHYARIAERFFTLQKDIYARRIETVAGARYDRLFEEADDFVKRMRTLLP